MIYLKTDYKKLVAKLIIMINYWKK